MDTKDFLKTLCESVSISGYEWQTPPARLIHDEFERYCDNVSVDNAGNIVGVKKGKPDGINILFAAHMDQIGLMVTNIDERGMVHFSTLGGFDRRTLLCQEVIVYGKEEIYGVIGMNPPHVSTPEDRQKVMKMESIGIDIGYDCETAKKLVKPGDLISIKKNASELKNDMLTARALDDAAGIASLLETMRILKDFNHNANIFFVATVQEEISKTGGAMIAAYNIKPDVAVAVDVGFANAPELQAFVGIEPGKGPSIGVGPAVNRKLYSRLKQTAKNNGIPYQVTVLPSHTSTDADAMQITGNGAVSGVLSIPLRYMHTPVETVKLGDIRDTGRLNAMLAMSYNDEPFAAF